MHARVPALAQSSWIHACILFDAHLLAGPSWAFATLECVEVHVVGVFDVFAPCSGIRHDEGSHALARTLWSVTVPRWSQQR